MKTMDITTIGEVLIDLTQTGVDSRGIPTFTANPGGAPANVAVAAAKLGAGTAFIGCVGRDSFGMHLRDVLEKNGVNASGLGVHAHVPTTLAVVSVDNRGERSFVFYRKPGADVCLSKEHVPQKLITQSKIVHFGSVSLTDDPARTTVMHAIEQAKETGALITYDPNYRASLWPDEETAIKISDEETELMTGEKDPVEAASLLMRNGVQLVLITLGAKGVYYRYGHADGVVDGFPVNVADTNGAGDTFFGAFLSRLSARKNMLELLSENELRRMLRFANCAAAITTSRPGAIPAMPTVNEVLQML